MRAFTLATLLALGAVTPLHAEALADLRTALARLQGGDAISAGLEIKQSVRDSAGQKPSAGQVKLNLQSGAQGLQLIFPPELMQQAEREAQAHTANPELPTPLGELLAVVTPTRAAQLLGSAPGLLRSLDGATVKESRGDALDGKPAQLLVLDVPGHLSAKQKDDLKHFEGQLKLWLDADGTPLASEETYKFNGRKLLIGFEGSESSNTRYAVSAGRLVAKTRTSRSSFKGFGEDNETVTTSTLSLP